MKCSPVQKKPLQPAVMSIIARVRNVCFDSRDGGREKETELGGGSQANYHLMLINVKTNWEKGNETER